MFFEAAAESITATMEFIEHLDSDGGLGLGEEEIRQRDIMRDKAYRAAQTLSALLVSPEPRRPMVWGEKRDLIRAILKSLEEKEILLPTTNADIEYGRWLERDARENG